MKKKKVLFIEDEQGQINVIKLRLEGSGFDFVSASDGEEGLKKIVEEKPDVILLDLIMPKMDGYEVCLRAKENPATRSIPILIITASGAKDLEEKCLEAGAKGVIMKPYDSKELVNLIRSLADEK